MDYIKAGRDILTKVMQPSIVQLSYSFPAIFFNVTWIQRWLLFYDISSFTYTGKEFSGNLFWTWEISFLMYARLFWFWLLVLCMICVVRIKQGFIQLRYYNVINACFKSFTFLPGFNLIPKRDAWFTGYANWFWTGKGNWWIKQIMVNVWDNRVPGIGNVTF